MNRDPELEQYLVDVAAKSAGLPGDGGVLAYADTRALPGPVIVPRDFDREIREEIADAVNYACWGIQAVWDRVLAGDPDVMDQYERHMRTLAALVQAWHALHTGSA